MNKIKELYSSPTTKILVVRFEGVLCGSVTPGEAGENNTYNSYDEDF